MPTNNCGNGLRSIETFGDSCSPQNQSKNSRKLVWMSSPRRDRRSIASEQRMKATIIIVAVTLLLTGCSRTPSDAEIRQKISGDWTPDFDTNFTWKIDQKPEGHFSKICSYFANGATNGWTEVGNWHLTNGGLYFSMTNVDWPNYKVPDEHYRVLRIDDHEMILMSGDKSVKVHKR